MYRLIIVIASVRENRGGLPVAEWFTPIARLHDRFAVEVIDLKTLDLPLLDEPNSPRLQRYTRDHTKQWSETVRGADAFVFVTPEYNAGTPPALVNALDYLYLEWHYKAAAFVSYGGISGGMRSVAMTKSLLTTLKMVPLVEAVTIPNYTQLLADGVFQGTDAHRKSATTMLNELARWTDALKTLRA